MPNFVITTPGAPTLPSSYTYTPITPTCTGAKNQICYIIAPDDGFSQPCFCSDNLLTEMAIALNINTDSAKVKLKP